MRWKIFYDSIFKREKERLEKIIKGKENKAAISMIKELFEDTREITDFFVGPALEKENIAETIMYMTEYISRNNEKGPLKDFLSQEQLFIISSIFKNFEEEMISYSKYIKNFAKYIEGWSITRLEEPVHREIEKHSPEAYSILYSMHESVFDIEDEEYESFVEKIKKAEHGLPGIFETTKKILFPDTKIMAQIYASLFSKKFLESWLAKDEFEWSRILPYLEKGIDITKEFFSQKILTLIERRKETEKDFEKIFVEWKNDLKNFQLEALANYASTKAQRKKLALKHERGIFE